LGRGVGDVKGLRVGREIGIASPPSVRGGERDGVCLLLRYLDLSMSVGMDERGTGCGWMVGVWGLSVWGEEDGV